MTVSTGATRRPAHEAHKAGTPSPLEQGVLWEMEERFWTGGVDDARATTASNAVMVFPYPPGILQGEQIWPHFRQTTGWRSVTMAERRVTQCRDLAVLTYRVAARKTDMPVHEALCASTYLTDDGTWLRISHQQTMVR